MRKLTKKIIQLRLKGMTYSKIVEKTGCVKSHVSYVCNKYIRDQSKKLHQEYMDNYKLNDEQQRNLRIGADKYYKNLRNKRKKEWITKLQQYKDQNFIYYISGLFDGDGNHVGSAFQITNSNYKLIKASVKFCKRVIKRSYSARLTLHTTHKKKKCVDYWQAHGVAISGITQIDTRKQHRSYKAKENYGTVRIAVKSPLGLREAIGTYSYK
jgi:hypothetical protein